MKLPLLHPPPLPPSELDLPGVGPIEHPALGSHARAYWRRRRRRSMQWFALLWALIAAGFIVGGVLVFVALYASIFGLGHTVGRGRGWDDGFTRAEAMQREVMMEVETVLNSLSDEDRERFEAAMREQHEGDE